MKKYRCKKNFSVDNYDDDGGLIENSCTIVETGEEYILDESGVTVIGGEAHLDHVSNGSWLEITKEHLHELFEEVE